MYFTATAAFVDKHSVLCELFRRGPVHNNTIACCFSGSHSCQWTEFWRGEIIVVFHKVLFWH